jgi:hypothetical protein
LIKIDKIKEDEEFGDSDEMSAYSNGSFRNEIDGGDFWEDIQTKINFKNKGNDRLLNRENMSSNTDNVTSKLDDIR